MTIEQVKAEAKKRFDKDLTDEQAQAWLAAHPAGELSDEQLDKVAGGSFDPDPSHPRVGAMWTCNLYVISPTLDSYVSPLDPCRGRCLTCTYFYQRRIPIDPGEGYTSAAIVQEHCAHPGGPGTIQKR